MVTDKQPERVVVVKEKMIKPNNLRQYYRPEYVRTMKRQELIAISEKIIVEGASLKHMYDNGLFSERALRRLVIEYMQDRDIVPKLRREILEKQIDYERDPLLRDSYNRDIDVRGETQSVFDQMLSRVETTNQPKLKLEKPKDQRSDNKKSSQPSKQASNILANALLILVIVFLIGLIIYLLQRG
jgi:adenine-specific DNA methylase